MKRYLLWSLGIHLLVVIGGTFIAPIGGVFGRAHKPTQIIPVSLVDFGDLPKSKAVAVPQPKLPTPAGDEAISLAPDKELTPEVIAEKEPETEPESPEEPEKPVEAKGKDSVGTNGEAALAQADTAAGVTHSISEGQGDGDVWGVETAPNVNPYHRRGFALIRGNWRNPIVGPTPRKCVVRFRILRSGEITDINVEQSSGAQIFDQAALRAVRRTRTWDQFPAYWEEDEQIIHLAFEYRPN